MKKIKIKSSLLPIVKLMREAHGFAHTRHLNPLNQVISAQGIVLKPGNAQAGVIEQTPHNRLIKLMETGELRTQIEGGATNFNLESTPSKTATGKVDNANAEVSGDPISLLTGEEILSITDVTLPGYLPFAWKRLYRSSLAEQQSGLGWGWTHTLLQRLRFDDGFVHWFNDNGHEVILPMPTPEEPNSVNLLAEASMTFAREHHHYVLTHGQGQGKYYFHRQGEGARLVAIRDDRGYGITLHYQPGSERLDYVVQDNGAYLWFDYLSSGLLAAVYRGQGEFNAGEQPVTPCERIVQFTYNNEGLLIGTINSLQEEETYRYRADHVLIQRRLAGGAEFNWQWQGEGKFARCLRQYANFAGLDEQYEWSDDGLMVTITQADGLTRVYQHNEQGLLIAEQRADGSLIQYACDQQGKVIARQDPLGNLTQRHYNRDGKLTAEVLPDGSQVSYHYLFDELRQVIKRAGPDQQIWHYRYDDDGLLRQMTEPDGRQTHYRYHPAGRVSEIMLPTGQRQHYQWDEVGRLTHYQSAEGQSWHYRYASVFSADPAEITDQDGQSTHYEYDALEQLTAVHFANQTSREYRYNAYGKVTWFKDEMGRETHYEYAAPLHLLTRKTLPDGSELRYRYDNIHLQVSEIINQKGEVYQLGYTPTGLLSEEIGFDGIKTAYRYDANGQLIEKQEFGTEHDTEPLITAYQRNSAGRLLVKTLPDSSEVRYQYDGLGRLVFVEDNGQVLGWEYDIADRLTAEHQNWATQRHTYDERTGQLTGSQLPDGQWVNYHYQTGRLQGMTLNNQPLAAFDYHNSGQIRERRQGNGLVNHYHYDESGRLSQHQLQESFLADPGTLWQQHYHYQADGELTDIRGSQARQYRYDDVGQLQAADYGRVRQSHSQRYDEQFIYDAAGNRVSSQSRDSSPGNRLAFYGDRHFDYDKFGNLVTERRGKGGKLVTTYQYDCRHRLVKMESYTGTIACYAYDTFNRRISKTVNGKLTEYVWQGNYLIAECSDKDTHWQSYIYEPGSYRPLALVTGHKRKSKQRQTYWYQNDRLGTPQLLTNSLGTIVYTGEYDAYGNLLRETHPVESGTGTQGSEVKLYQPLRLQGQYYDGESGLYYNLNRYYDPQLGRYLTQDPIKLAGGLNGYQYVDGNPVGWVDPLGLFKQSSTGHESNHVKTDEPDIPKVDAAKGTVSIPNFGSVNDFMSNQTKNINSKLGGKIGEGRLPYGTGKEAFEKARNVVEQTLSNPTEVTNIIPKSVVRGNHDLMHVYSSKTDSTVSLRVSADGKYDFDTLIPEKSSKFK